MARRASPPLVSLWLLSLCSVAWAGLHRLSSFQLISPEEAPGLPKRLSVLRVNDLVLAAYDSDSGRLAPRNGFSPGDQEFWREIGAWYLAWDSWVETECQVLMEEMNSSAPQANPYYMQVLQACELDNATGAVQVIARYALNRKDVLQYQSDHKHWFVVHPAAQPVAERWNQKGASFAVMNVHTAQQCRTLIGLTAPFTAQQTAQPTAHVALVPGTQARPCRLVCHVTGFYPRNIEVTWERGGQGTQGEQLSSRILPNGDPTFQIQVSIELGQEGPSPTEHVCVVRHSSLGNTPLRVTWDSKATDQTVTVVIVGVCILAALGVGALVWHLRRKSVWRRLNIDHTHPLPGKRWQKITAGKHQGDGADPDTIGAGVPADLESISKVRRRLNIDHTHPLPGKRWQKITAGKHQEDGADPDTIGAGVPADLESISKGEIIGEHEAEPHSRPYMAYLEIQCGDETFCCSGFLVSENFVLTTADCQGDSINVILGAHNINKREPSQQVIPVRRQIRHPRYNKNIHNNDIMLLELSRRATLNNWVRTIALSFPSERVKPGTECSVAGWGRSSKMSSFAAERLHEAHVVVLKDETCQRNPHWFSHPDGPYCHYDPSTMMSTGHPETGQDPVSHGYVGGPLVCAGRAHGIVSCGSKYGNYPTVYTRVAAFLPWIEEMMWS